MNNLPKIGVPLLIAITFGFLVLGKSFVTIESGEAGVLYKLFGGGVVTDEPPLGEGFHVILPWNNVIIYEVRQQNISERMDALSVDGLQIQLEASIWFQPKYEYLGKLHKEKSEAYKERIVLPAIKSAARSVIGKYTPEELYSSKRDAIEKEIFDETQLIVDEQYVQLNRILVREIILPSTIKAAIERKLTQEQQSEEYEFRLEIAEQEAERQIIEAKGKANANRELAASLTPNILKDKGIEATLKLAESSNSKVVIVGSGKDGLPLILGNN